MIHGRPEAGPKIPPALLRPAGGRPEAGRGWPEARQGKNGPISTPFLEPTLYKTNRFLRILVKLSDFDPLFGAKPLQNLAKMKDFGQKRGPQLDLTMCTSKPKIWPAGLRARTMCISELASGRPAGGRPEIFFRAAFFFLEHACLQLGGGLPPPW